MTRTCQMSTGLPRLHIFTFFLRKFAHAFLALVNYFAVNHVTSVSFIFFTFKFLPCVRI